MFGKRVNTAILKHGSECFPQESCGIIVDKKYLPMKNTHPDPENFFEVDQEAVREHIIAETLQGVAHTHTNGNREPSYDDLKTQISMDIPWGLATISGSVGSEVVWWGKDAPVLPLLGRDFLFGVWDCYTLAIDYYAKQGIELQPVAKNREMLSDGTSLFLDNLEATGFTQITREELQEGDGVLLRIGGKVPNHCAIYTKDGLMLHHIVDRMSREEPIYPWAKFITHYLRPPQ